MSFTRTIDFAAFPRPRAADVASTERTLQQELTRLASADLADRSLVPAVLAQPNAVSGFTIIADSDTDGASQSQIFNLRGIEYETHYILGFEILTENFYLNRIGLDFRFVGRTGSAPKAASPIVPAFSKLELDIATLPAGFELEMVRLGTVARATDNHKDPYMSSGAMGRLSAPISILAFADSATATTASKTLVLDRSSVPTLVTGKIAAGMTIVLMARASNTEPPANPYGEFTRLRARFSGSYEHVDLA